MCPEASELKKWIDFHGLPFAPMSIFNPSGNALLFNLLLHHWPIHEKPISVCNEINYLRPKHKSFCPNSLGGHHFKSSPWKVPSLHSQAHQEYCGPRLVRWDHLLKRSHLYPWSYCLDGRRWIWFKSWSYRWAQKWSRLAHWAPWFKFMQAVNFRYTSCGGEISEALSRSGFKIVCTTSSGPLPRCRNRRNQNVGWDG